MIMMNPEWEQPEKPEQPEIITAKHWLPDHIEDWNTRGDLRARLDYLLGYHRRDPIVMDPDDPKPVKVVTANWFHGDVHGVMTRDIFEEDLTNTIGELSRSLREDYPDGFVPVRIYKDAEPAYGVGSFDWRGPPYCFDVRAVVQFGTWQVRDDDGNIGNSAGFKFHIATLVEPTADDADVYVGRDWGVIFDG